MEEFLNQLAVAALGRLDGPLHFRLFLQPVMAVLLAVRDGRADAKTGRTPYFWSLFTEPERRGQRLRDGWKSLSKVFLLAVGLDLAYQFLVMHEIHPLRAMLVAMVLALFPYVAIRGLVTRLARSAAR